MCSPGSGSRLRSLNIPGMSELWTEACHHPGRLLSHQEEEKERAKLLQEFPVQVLQVSRLDRPVARLIGAATAPGTRPSQHLACPLDPATSGTPVTSAQIVLAGASARTAAPSCCGCWGRACQGTSARQSMSRTQTPCISRRRYRRIEQREGAQRGRRVRRATLWRGGGVKAGSTGGITSGGRTPRGVWVII